MRFLLTIVLRMDTHSGYYKQNTHTAATWPDAQFRMENAHTDTERNCLYGNLVLFLLLRQVRIPEFYFTKTISRFFFRLKQFTT